MLKALAFCCCAAAEEGDGGAGGGASLTPFGGMIACEECRKKAKVNANTGEMSDGRERVASMSQ